MNDLNKMEYIGGKDMGCSTEQHLYDFENSEVRADGNLTVLVVKCIRCGFKRELSSFLNINDHIGQNKPVRQDQLKEPTINVEPPINEDNRIANSDILKRLFNK